jgi:hypothetical protein
MNTNIQGQAPARPKLLTADTPILILPSLASAFGIVEAAFLQQLHYLIQQHYGITHQGQRWIYNTLAQWQAQLPCWSVATLERAITHLKKRGIIHIAKLGNRKSDRTNYYRIDYSTIPQLLDFDIPSTCDHDPLNLMESTPQSDENHDINMMKSIPSECANGSSKNTKENSKNTSKIKKPDFLQKSGSETPTHPEPSSSELAALPSEQTALWRQLRHLKLDISPTDSRLRYWQDRCMVKHILQTLMDYTDRRWRTPEQLGLVY